MSSTRTIDESSLKSLIDSIADLAWPVNAAGVEQWAAKLNMGLSPLSDVWLFDWAGTQGRLFIEDDQLRAGNLDVFSVGQADQDGVGEAQEFHTTYAAAITAVLGESVFQAATDEASITCWDLSSGSRVRLSTDTLLFSREPRKCPKAVLDFFSPAGAVFPQALDTITDTFATPNFYSLRLVVEALAAIAWPLTPDDLATTLRQLGWSILERNNYLTVEDGWPSAGCVHGTTSLIHFSTELAERADPQQSEPGRRPQTPGEIYEVRLPVSDDLPRWVDPATRKTLITAAFDQLKASLSSQLDRLGQPVTPCECLGSRRAEWDLNSGSRLTLRAWDTSLDLILTSDRYAWRRPAESP